MSRKRLLTLLLIAVAALHFGALASRVAGLESVLTTGERHLFRAAPVDPVDYFSGRYVAINLQDVEFATDENFRESHHYDEKYWIAIERGEDGFSRFAAIVDENHPGAKVMARAWPTDKNKVRVDPPFSRFYMNEKLAPLAEAAYNRSARRDGPRDAWVAVRIKDGMGVIEELYVNGKPVAEALKDEPPR